MADANVVYSIVHDIGWAVREMKAGKRVRRRAWTVGSRYITLATCPILHFTLWQCNGGIVRNTFIPSCEDMLGEDWEVVEP